MDRIERAFWKYRIRESAGFWVFVAAFGLFFTILILPAVQPRIAVGCAMGTVVDRALAYRSTTRFSSGRCFVQIPNVGTRRVYLGCPSSPSAYGSMVVVITRKGAWTGGRETYDIVPGMGCPSDLSKF